ncbi:MAG: glycosyltransferase [Candidatus Saccharimonadaceae bacterium]
MSTISIIMPVYNVEKYLHRSIKSVIDQTYSDFELIIVNDGSTDNSEKLINHFVDEDNRIKVINKENGGLSDARNAGLEVALGEYIIFIDSDDYWDSLLLEKTFTYMKESQLDLVIFGFQFDYYNQSDQLSQTSSILEGRKIFTKYNNTGKIDNTGLIGYAWNKLYKAELISQNKIRFEKGISYIEDSLFNEKVYKEASRIGFLDEVLYHYSQRRDETLGIKYFANMANLDIMANNAFKSMLQSLGQLSDEVERLGLVNLYLRVRWSLTVVANSEKIPRNVKVREIRQLIELIKSELQGANIGNSLSDKVYRVLITNERISSILLIENVKAKKYKRFVLDLMSNAFKGRLTYITSRNDAYFDLKRSEKKIIVALAADYGNLGDVAITYAQVKYLERNFKEYRVIKLPISRTYHDVKSLKRKMTRNDIITIVGGGNMGNLYQDIEDQRKFIISLFPNNKIVSFPQTIDFSETYEGLRSQKDTQRLYDHHKKLVLLAREQKTFNKMKSLFNSHIILAPDIVLSLDESSSIKNRRANTITLCIRKDEESRLKGGEQQKIAEYLQDELHSEIIYRDTHIGDVTLSDERAILELNSIWSIFRESRLVITDRLHGMIFCAITNTPCVAINNSNGKVFGVHKLWLSESKNIVMIEDFTIDAIRNAVEFLGNQNTVIKNDFNVIKEAIEKR